MLYQLVKSGQRGSHIVEKWSRMVNGYDVWGISTNFENENQGQNFNLQSVQPIE